MTEAAAPVRVRPKAPAAVKRRRNGDIDIPVNAHPLYKELLTRVNSLKLPLSVVARRSGLARMSLTRWRRHSPSLVNFEAVLNSVGLELCIRAKRQ